MKTLNYFFEKAPLWQIFVLIWFLTGVLITAPIFYGLQKIGATNPELDFSGMNCIKLGAGVGLLLGLISMFMVSMMRKILSNKMSLRIFIKRRNFKMLHKVLGIELVIP